MCDCVISCATADRERESPVKYIQAERNGENSCEDHSICMAFKPMISPVMYKML